VPGWKLDLLTVSRLILCGHGSQPNYRNIIGAAIEVHRELGPGKPEAAYETALGYELGLRQFDSQIQKPVPVRYNGVKLECGYRLDILVAGRVVLEIKSVEIVLPVHRAQVLTYLKLGGWQIALLLNFNVAILKEGIERLVLGLQEQGSTALPASSARVIAERAGQPSLYSANDSGDEEAERLARDIIASAKEVHRELGPGLLHSTYHTCLCHELSLRGLPFERQHRLPLQYRGVSLPTSDEIDILVGGRVVIVPCSLTAIEPVHEAALLSQLRLGGWKLGLLLNFNTIAFGEGIRRIVLSGNKSLHP
jgi:GxxExxY protein